MPGDRTRDQVGLVIASQKKYGCDHPSCFKAFARSHDLLRHKKIHCGYEERQFGCPFEGCRFRSNQQAGLKCHVNSVHENVRLACDEPGCRKTFSDPSSRTKHRQKFHPASVESNTMGHAYHRAESRKRKAPYPVAVHARVARHVEEHSRQDAKDVLNQFATFALEASTSNPSTPSSNDPSSDQSFRDSGPSTLHGTSSTLPSSTHGPIYTSQSTPCELPGVFHRATDVPTDCWSIDINNKPKHQRAYDANHPTVPTAWGYSSDGLVSSRPPYPLSTRWESTFGHPSSTQHPHPGIPRPCRCWDCVVMSPLTLASPRGQHQD